MEVEKLTAQQHFHQRPLMGKGTYEQGPKQCSKAVAGFYGNTFFVQVREIPLANNYLH